MWIYISESKNWWKVPTSPVKIKCCTIPIIDKKPICDKCKLYCIKSREYNDSLICYDCYNYFKLIKPGFLKSLIKREWILKR